MFNWVRPGCEGVPGEGSGLEGEAEAEQAGGQQGGHAEYSGVTAHQFLSLNMLLSCSYRQHSYRHCYNEIFFSDL